MDDFKEGEFEFGRVQEEMDKIDETFLELIEKRKKLSIDIARWKKQENIPTLDYNEEILFYQKLDRMVSSTKLTEGFAKKIWSLLLDDTKRRIEELGLTK